MLKQVLERQLQPLAVGPGDHLRAQNGVTAKLKEIIIDADLLDAQQLAPDLDQLCLLGRASGNWRRPFAGVRSIEGIKSPPIKLATGGKWQAFKRDDR